MYLIVAGLTDEQIAFRVGIVVGVLIVVAFVLWFKNSKEPKN